MKSRFPSVFSRVIATLLIVTVSPLGATPQGAQVVRGDVTISYDDDLTRVTAGNDSIINYDSFNIGSGETVQFIQPGASSRVFNRVIGNNPSAINGRLLANGQVYLVNPFGVYFGNSAVVDVGGLYAAAGSLADEDFLNGNNRFTDLYGSVINRGFIRGSAIHLLGQYVANLGSIVAPNGVVTITAGNELWVGDSGGHIFVKLANNAEPPTTPSGDQGVEVSGTIDAGTGSVFLGAADLFALAISTTGKITAQDITIQGGAGSTVEIAGTLDASAHSEATAGGTITVTGEKVGLYGASLDVSGSTGGGTILVGGDIAGQGDLATARVTLVDADTEILADAGQAGDGGTVVVWGDEWTRFHGNISAKGGTSSGDAGFVEVSGKKSLFFDGTVDVTAASGATGTLLLDPESITIYDGAPRRQDDDLPDLSNTTVGTNGGFKISEESLEALAADTNLILEASQHIQIKNLKDDTLALPIDGTGSVTMRADSDDNGTGDFIMEDRDDTIETQGADVTITAAHITAGSFDTTAGGTTAGSLTLTATKELTVEDINAGAVTLTADKKLTTEGDITASGSTTILADADNDAQGLLRIKGDIDTNNNSLYLAGADFDLSGTIDSGTALTTLAATAGRDVGVGRKKAGFDIDNDEMEMIASERVAVQTTGDGDIIVEGVTAESTAGITDLTLSAANDVIFTKRASSFTHSLTAEAGGLTSLEQDLASTTGSLHLAGGEGLVLDASATAGDDLALIASDGNIVISTDFTAGDTMTIASQTGSIIQSAGTITASVVDLDAATGIGTTGALQLATNTLAADTTSGDINIDNAPHWSVEIESLTTGAGNLRYNQQGDNTLTLVNARTQDGDIDITTGDDIFLGYAEARNNTVSITTAGDLQDAQDDLLTDIEATNVNLNVAGTIGGTSLAGGFLGAESTVEIPALLPPPPPPEPEPEPEPAAAIIPDAVYLQPSTSASTPIEVAVQDTMSTSTRTDTVSLGDTVDSSQADTPALQNTTTDTASDTVDSSQGDTPALQNATADTASDTTGTETASLDEVLADTDSSLGEGWTEARDSFSASLEGYSSSEGSTSDNASSMIEHLKSSAEGQQALDYVETVAEAATNLESQDLGTEQLAAAKDQLLTTTKPEGVSRADWQAMVNAYSSSSH